jgi:hypothetical protein
MWISCIGTSSLIYPKSMLPWIFLRALLVQLLSKSRLRHSTSCASKTSRHVIIDLFQKAQRMWVQRLKDYRDCFMHYTPVDTLLVVTLRKYQTGWEVRAKLPVNPNVREILGFRYSRRVELMRYAITTHKHLATFDRTVAEAIWRLYRNGNFPVRKNHLFFVGRRTR